MANGNRRDDAVDSILEELKTGGNAPAGASGAQSGKSLDEIMAELGFDATPRRGGAPRMPRSPSAVEPAPRPQPQSQPVAPAARPAPPRPAAPPVAPAPAPRPQQAAPQPAAPPPQQWQPEPAPQQAPAPAGDVWDMQLEQPPAAPMRTGKAAAMDRVDPEKFRGDTELLSWFSGEDGTATNKKEQKKLEKNRKKRLAEERKAQKRAAAEQDDYDDDIDDGYTSAGQPEDMFEDAQPDAFAAEDEGFISAFAEQNAPQAGGLFGNQPFYEADDEGFFAAQPDTFAPPEADAPNWNAPPDDNVVTGSAFGQPWGSDDWAAEEDILDTAEHATQQFDIAPEEQGEYPKVPTAAFTQEFDELDEEEGNKSLYVEEMVDDRFREFFSETVIVDKDDTLSATKAGKKKSRKRRHQLLTGEFAKLADEVDDGENTPVQVDDDEYAEYNSPKDAPEIEQSLHVLSTSLLRRFILNLVAAVLLLWMGLGASGVLPLPGFVSPVDNAMVFSLTYLGLVLLLVGLNFTTVAPGIVGLAGESTVDTPPALAAVGVLLQAVVVVIQMITAQTLTSTLFGGAAALLLAFNALGKHIRARSIIDNFRLASAGEDHSAAYVLDDTQDITYAITRGLDEGTPSLLVSRPTALVKGFMRQSFSERWSDSMGRKLGWVLFASSVVAAVFTFFQTKDLLAAISAFAAVLCIGAPLTSSLVSGLPSMLMQRGASKVGAVVPGWSAIEDLGQVNVVMASGRDLFPPASVSLHGLRAAEMHNINNAILYAASVVVEGCDTLRDIFLALINNRTDTLLKVESLTTEPGRGFTAWVDGKRVVLGTREMLQKHDIDPPSIESEMHYITSPDRKPLYLAVSGRLYGMFVLGYAPDEEVQETLEGLIRSGVSLLVTSSDMNITSDLVEQVYQLPQGLVKVLGPRELEMLEPLTGYLDESEGVMSHIGTFTSFIGGMRAAASCAAAERLGGILQMVSVIFACLLSLVLAFFGGLSGMNIFLLLLCQAAWSLVAVAIPFGRRY